MGQELAGRVHSGPTPTTTNRTGLSSRRELLSGLYALADRQGLGMSPVEATRLLLGAGVRVIQLRDKGADAREYFDEALQMASLCRSYGALFIVNDRIDVALAAGADGVHLGQDDLKLAEARKEAGPGFIIGVSTHSIQQALEAEAGGADYIGFGPMFHTSTKDAGEPKGASALRQVRSRVKIPIAAIGGITIDNVAGVFEAGADMAAVASGLLGTGNLVEGARRFISMISKNHQLKS